MNKKSLLIVVVVIVLLLGVSVFFTFSKLKNNGLLSKIGSTKNLVTTGKTIVDNVQNSDKSITDTIKGTFDQLITGGKSLRCTFSENTESTKNESVLFVSGKKVSLEGTTVDEEKNEDKFYMISDGDWAYVWGTQLNTGIKMKYSDFNKDENGVSNGNSLGQNIFQSLKGTNYNCKPWVVDNSKFVPPSNIEFKDLSAMMEGIQQQTDKLKEEYCQNCAKLDTEEQIQSCKEGLNCE